MKIIRSLHDFEDIFSISEYPDEYRLDSEIGMNESLVSLKSQTSNEWAKRIFIDGANISFIHKTNSEDFAFYVRTDSPYLQMHFEFEGAAFYTAREYGGMDCSIPQGTHCLFYFPALHGKLVYPTVTNGFSVQIEISLTFLNRAFNNNLEILGNFDTHVKNESPVMLGGKSFPLTGSIKNTLMEMYNCPYIGQLKKLFIEGKLLELLCFQVAQITGNIERSEKLRPDELRQVSQARDIIHENLSNPYSIETLAEMIGMNRTKLQECFKKAYGNTIFGYLTDVRMELAKDLLLNQEYIKISEIARKIGYKNPHHFSAAFKRKFGTTPRLHK